MSDSKDPLEPRFAVGDLHGCFDALQALIEFVPIRDDEVLITLGDYVDRGPDSRQVLDWVIERSERDCCLPLRGNHDLVMQLALEGKCSCAHWFSMGGIEVMMSYGLDQREVERQKHLSFHKVPESHRQFITNRLLPYYETADMLFVHATLDADRDLAAQDDSALYWDRFDSILPHQSGKRIICGHTAQKSGYPANRGYAICIDTKVYAPDGWLTCLDLKTGQYWQANQQRKTRSGNLTFD